MKQKHLIELICLIAIIFQVVAITSYAQENNVYISKYLQRLELLNSRINSKQNLSPKDRIRTAINEITIKELKHLAKIMYVNSEVNYFEMKDSLHYASMRIRFGNKNSMRRQFTPSYIHYKILEKIQNSISPLVYGLIRIPYFLHIKIKNVSIEIPTGQDVLHAPTTVVEANIVEVIKGNSEYNNGDPIQFYFYNSWSHNELKFIVDKDYFVALEPRGKNSSNPDLALVEYLDDSDGYYPINGDKILDSHDFFGLGKNPLYKEFVQNLKQKIQEIQSW